MSGTQPRLRVLFAGTPEFAAQALAAIARCDAQIEVVAVYTQPDRPSGRGMQLQASAVKQLALDLGIPVEQPASLKSSEVQERLRSWNADVMVVAAYGLILPQAVLDLPRFGCLNIHASLLPRWRGAAPIHRAIEAGDTQTGITIMQMEAGLDTGPMLMREVMLIQPEDTTASLHNRLAAMGGNMIVQALERLRTSGAAAFVPEVQPQAADSPGVSYAHKVLKSESQIDWSQDAEQIARRLRAFDPFPGMSTQLDGVFGGQVFKVWAGNVSHQAQLQHLDSQANVSPGTVLRCDAQGLQVVCGQAGSRQSVLIVTQVQKPGARRQALRDVWQSLGWVAPGSRATHASQ